MTWARWEARRSQGKEGEMAEAADPRFSYWFFPSEGGGPRVRVQRGEEIPSREAVPLGFDMSGFQRTDREPFHGSVKEFTESLGSAPYNPRYIAVKASERKAMGLFDQEFEKRIRKDVIRALESGYIAESAVDTIERVFGVEVKMPFKVSREGYLWSNLQGSGHPGLVVTQNPDGTTSSQPEREKYVNTLLADDLAKQRRNWVGGTKVRMTIEEVVD